MMIEFGTTPTMGPARAGPRARDLGSRQRLGRCPQSPLGSPAHARGPGSTQAGRHRERGLDEDAAELPGTPRLNGADHVVDPILLRHFNSITSFANEVDRRNYALFVLDHLQERDDIYLITYRCEYVEAQEELIKIRANIQPSMASYRTQLLPQGDRNKEAISIYSNDWLYTCLLYTSPSPRD